jgi:chromosome partitioning protein
MRSIAILNQKGGVGKTTTAVNLSAALAATGQRVCLIDLDPQAHATLHLGLQPARDEQSVYDVLTGDVRLEDVWRQCGENLWVAGSHINLAAAEVELVGVVGREVILRDKLAACGESFDYVFIDCPPSLGILTLNALAAVDEVFLPLQPHFLALHGLSKLLQTIDLVARRLNDRLKLSGVGHAPGQRSIARRRAVLSRDPRPPHALGRDAAVRNPHPPQYPPGRSPELWAVDLPLRARLQRGRGL